MAVDEFAVGNHLLDVGLFFYGVDWAEGDEGSKTIGSSCFTCFVQLCNGCTQYVHILWGMRECSAW